MNDWACHSRAQNGEHDAAQQTVGAHDLDRQPADLGHLARIHATADGGGELLAAETDAEHGQAVFDGRREQATLAVDEGELGRLVGVHRTAEHDQAGDLAELPDGRHGGPGVKLSHVDGEAGVDQGLEQRARLAGGLVLDDDDGSSVGGLITAGRYPFDDGEGRRRPLGAALAGRTGPSRGAQRSAPGPS